MDQFYASENGIFDNIGRTIPVQMAAGARQQASAYSVISAPMIPSYDDDDDGPIPEPQILPLSIQPVAVKKRTINQYLITTQAVEDKPQMPMDEPEMPPADKTKCTGPGELCDPDMNQMIYNILTREAVDISCACDKIEFYPFDNPIMGDFNWTIVSI